MAGFERRGRPGGHVGSTSAGGDVRGAAPGKRSLVESIAGHGLPHGAAIQRSFGRHDVSSVQAEVGGAAAEASATLGATAFARGDRVGFAEAPDLRTAAHEAAHVVQQRAGLAPAEDATADPADPYERHADRVADAVVEGRSAEPILDELVRGRGEAAPATAVQLQRDPLRGIDLYLKVNEVQIWRTVAQHLAAVPWPEPHPNVEWLNESRFGLAVAEQLQHDAPLDEPAAIHARVFPANHRDVLRPLLPVYTRSWLPGIGRALAELFEDAVRASLRRLGPRYAAVAEHDPRRIGGVAYDQLVKSHPIDRPVGLALVRSGVASYIPTANPPDRSTRPRALRPVTLEWQGAKDPSLWNWVRAVTPADASVEEVAASLYSTYGDQHPGESGSTLAYGLVPAPPLFGLPPSWARAFSAAARHAPAHAASDDAERGARMVALAESQAGDDVALAQGRAAAARATTPKTAEIVATLGDSLIAVDYLHRALAPWKQSRATAAARRWILEKQARLSTMDPKELGTWAPIIDGQKERLLRIVAGVKQVTELAPGMGAGDATSVHARPILGVLSSYAQAAALAHLADTSEQWIAEAAQQQRQLAITMLRGVTNEMDNAVGAAAAARQRGVSSLVLESDEVAADSRRLQNQLAAGEAADAAAIEETTLHAQEVTLRTRVEGLFWAVRALRNAVDKAGDGIKAHIAKQFHGSFRTLEEAIRPIEGTILRLAANLQSEEAVVKRGAWEDPAEQRRQRRIYLRNNQRELDALAGQTDLVEFFRQGAETVQWQRFASLCVQALALIGVAFVAHAAGGMAFRAAQSVLVRAGSTQAVAEIASGGSLLARASALAARGTAGLAGAGVEAGINTAGQLALGGGKPGEAFFTNLLATIGANAIVGQIAKDLAVARSIEAQTAGLWAKAGHAGKALLKEAVTLTAHTVMNVAIGYVAHMVVTRKQATAMQAREWLLQGLSIGIGRYVGGAVKARRPSHEKLARLPELEGQRLLAAGDELAQLAKAAEAQPSEAATTELLAKRSALLEQERHMLETIERHPELLRAHPAAKLTAGDVKAALASVRHEQAGLAPHARRLILESAGLEEIVPNTEYRGSGEQLARVLESARRIGLPIGAPQKAGKTTRIAIGGAEIVFHEGAATPSAPPKRPPEEQFLEDLRARLGPDERAKLEQMIGRRKAEDLYRQFGGDLEAARKQVAAATARARTDEAAAVASTVKADQIRTFVEDTGLMREPRAREIVEVLERKTAELEAKKAAAADAVTQKRIARQIATVRSDAVASLRSYVTSEYMQMQLASRFPGSRVRKDVQVWQEQGAKYKTPAEFKAANGVKFEKANPATRLIDTPDGQRVYLEITDVDLMVTVDQPSGKSRILHAEEIKTGHDDSPQQARAQLDKGVNAISEAAAGGARVRLFEGGKDITDQIDLSSMQKATSSTRGPSNKKLQASLGLTSKDLEAMVDDLLDTELSAQRPTTPTKP